MSEITKFKTKTRQAEVRINTPERDVMDITPSDHFAWYPFLASLLRDRGMTFKASYTTREVAEIFEVTTWSIRDLVASGRLRSHRLPAHKRFLARDLEDYLAASFEEGH